MKTTIKTTLLLAIIACIFWVACKKNESGSQESESAIVASPEMTGLNTKDAPQKLGWIPPGAKTENKDGEILVTAPQGWGYIGTDEKGQTIKVAQWATTSTTCTCSTSGDCKPFAATSPFGNTTGCHGTCTKCSMSQSTTGTKGSIIVSGGYYQVASETRLLKNGEYAPAVFDALFQSDEYQKALRVLYGEAYQGKEVQHPIKNEDGSIAAPKGFSIVGALILGRAAVIVLPSEYVTRQLGYAAADKATCSCSASGDCTLHEKKFAGWGSSWCAGTCNGCTLTTSSLSSNNSYQVSIKSFTY